VQRLLPSGKLDWRRLSPSLKVAPISVGEEQYELALHRIDAGGKAPAHDHLGKEITVVLTGSFSDEDGVYQPGDFLVREQGDTHRPFAARNQECICLSVLEAPINLTGIKRVLNPFLSFTPS
jgi:putative transcriptional regulator